jgi:hypothetical protein
VKFEIVGHNLARMRYSCGMDKGTLLVAIHGYPQSL